MTEQELKLITGALLHDIGKVLFRTGERKKHSLSGYEFLREEAEIRDHDVLDMVKYHHSDMLFDAQIADDSMAYIVYIADNIAAATDRRENDDTEKGFNPQMPLESIFNLLNGNTDNYHYRTEVLDDELKINMPTKEDISFDASFYKKIKVEFLHTLKGIENWNESYINSLLLTAEAYLSYIPSSTAIHELADISLYDHLKMTAAYSSCILAYLDYQKQYDYKTILYRNAKDFYKMDAFRLFSMDISGIQNFIYTIHSKDALKMLRSRSFYLEILMEHMIDELLSASHLSRANLIYSGGGHCYILLPNTETIQEIIKERITEYNDFFAEEFGISLFVASASVSCNAENLKNLPKGSYSKLFQQLSEEIGEKKASRYTSKQIINMNIKRHNDDTRECRVCKNVSPKSGNDACEFCSSMMSFSADILYKSFFTVLSGNERGTIPLPGNKYLIAQTEEELRETMESDSAYVRTYGKNRFYTGKDISTKLWIGDYTQKGKTTDIYADEATGIKRIAVLRADVDDLGKTIVSGFPEEYTTLSRTAAFSRQMSLFFKRHINTILSEARNGVIDKTGARNATIVYSGGDDLFIVGSWDDVIGLALDIQMQFDEYTIGKMTLSAGIGIYPPKYPLSVIAEEVAALESKSKHYPDAKLPEKDSLTLFEADFDYTFHWDIFSDEVCKEKLRFLEDFLETAGEKGNAFLYRLLELIGSMDDRINLARFAYFVSRLQLNEEAPEKKNRYMEFAKKMYQWVQDIEDRRQIVMAIYLYIYLHRKGEEE